jgi:putative spermidine/putrescine transport system permease protein
VEDVPDILPGVISAALLTFSTVMGEFTLASLFTIYTFPVYLNNTVGQSDPRRAALLAILSFIFTLICVLGIILLVRRGPRDARKEGQIEIATIK